MYWLIANALTRIEQGLHSARGVCPLMVRRKWQVQERIQEPMTW